MITNKHLQNVSKTKINFILRFISLLFFSLFASLILTSSFMSQFAHLTSLIGIGFDLTRIFISLCIFGVVWITSDFDNILLRHRFLAFGLFVVAILDIFYVSTSIPLSFYPSDVTMRYWLDARFVEGFVLILMTYPTTQKLKSRGILLLISITTASFIIIITQFSSLFPPLYTEGGLTHYTKIIEYVIVLVYSFALFRQHKVNVRNDQYTHHQYLSLAILSFILSALIYIPLKNPISFTMALGYTVRLGGYFFLLRSVFVLFIIYPYKELNFSKNKLNDVLDKLPLGIISYDKNLVITYANQHALNLLECDLLDICNMTRDEYFVKFQIVDSVINHDIKKLQTSKGKELIFKTSDIHFENGIICTIKDAKIEQELENFNMHTHAILNAINNQVIILDKNHKIIDCNHCFLACMDIQKESIVGLHYNEYNDMIHLKYNGENYKVADAFKCNFNEYTLLTPTGKHKTVLLQYKDITDLYGKVIGYVSIAIDLTQFKKDQEMLQNQERLALIGQMGSGIVHETKNYLASIKGYCELLLLNLEDTRQIGYASKIQFLANDMNGLVTDYLNLSKPSEIILDIISLNELIESIQYILESPSFVLDSSLELDLCETDIEVLADNAHIKHVIINLAKNAIEAMKDRENSYLKIKTKCKKDSMHVMICDNGMGISPENLTKLGTPFFTTKKTGTGLGLSNCYKIVADCGGQIFVESQIDKGTTFTIEFPFYKEEEQYLQEVYLEEA